MTRLTGLLIVAILTGYGVYAFAQDRASVRVAVTPVASSSSNGVSFAWFYDQTDRTVYLCRTLGDVVDCKSRTTLP